MGELTADSDATVLIVDDDRDLADTYAAWLDREGFDVLTAYGGEEALAALEPAIDLVLLDRRMPHLPGDSVLVEARERRGDYQIAMLTAVEPDRSILEMPFDEYLTKPVSRGELVDAVERLSLRDSLDDELQELFRLSSKLSALEARPGDADGAAAELEAELEAKQDQLHEKLQSFDDHEEVFALVEEQPAGHD